MSPFLPTPKYVSIFFPDKIIMSRKHKNKDVSEFVMKTFKMIQEGDPEIVAWCEDGESFVIKDNDQFVKQLPDHFRHSNLKSFIRQLNAYSFRQLKYEEIKDKCKFMRHFKHEFFQRDKPELLPKIKQKRNDQETESSQELRMEVKNMKEWIKRLESTVKTIEGNVAIVRQGLESQCADIARCHEAILKIREGPPIKETLSVPSKARGRQKRLKPDDITVQHAHNQLTLERCSSSNSTVTSSNCHIGQKRSRSISKESELVKDQFFKTDVYWVPNSRTRSCSSTATATLDRSNSQDLGVNSFPDPLMFLRSSSIGSNSEQPPLRNLEGDSTSPLLDTPYSYSD